MQPAVVDSPTHIHSLPHLCNDELAETTNLVTGIKTKGTLKQAKTGKELDVLPGSLDDTFEKLDLSNSAHVKLTDLKLVLGALKSDIETLAPGKGESWMQTVKNLEGYDESLNKVEFLRALAEVVHNVIPSDVHKAFWEALDENLVDLWGCQGRPKGLLRVRPRGSRAWAPVQVPSDPASPG